MTIYFANQEPLDEALINLQGLSIKEHDNPIGQFGTGLKYSIAVILRLGGAISFTIAGKTTACRTEKRTARGQEYGAIFYGDQQLSITTGYGKNWEPWMVYRELMSNALDEGGQLFEHRKNIPSDYQTIIAVTCPAIEQVRWEHHEIFLQSEALEKASFLNIHPGESQYIYHRGVRALKLKNKSKLTYNFIAGVSLTEDRTISQQYLCDYYAAAALVRTGNQTVIDMLFSLDSEKQHYFETEIDFPEAVNTSELSESFQKAAIASRSDLRLPQKLLRLCNFIAERTGVEEDFIEFSASQYEQLNAAMAWTIEHLDANYDGLEFRLKAHLGEGVLAAARRNTITLTPELFEQGMQQLCGCIYEEYLHCAKGFDDYSHRMQAFLFNKLVAIAAKTAPIPEIN